MLFITCYENYYLRSILIYMFNQGDLFASDEPTKKNFDLP